MSLAAGLVAFAAVRVWMRRSGQMGGRTLAVAIAALALVAIAVALVVPSEVRARVQTLARITNDNAGAYRIGIWRDTLRLAAASPVVGTGFGAYEDAIPRFKSAVGDHRIEHAENDYVEVLAEGGLAGGLLAGLVALVAISVALARIRDEPHRLSRGIRSGALAGMAALLVHSAFDFNLRIPSNALLFVLLAAFALAPAGRVADEAAPEQRARRRSAGLLSAAALAVATVLAFATPWTGRRFESAQLLRTAGSDTVGLRWRSLERDTIAHLRRRPADATAWVGLGWLRRPRSQAEAAALASWGVGLDPRYEVLRRAAERVTGAPGTQQREP